MSNKLPKVLIISRNSWNESNNVGNTLSNIFGQWDAENIANIFCRAEEINNNICNTYYRITEKDLVESLVKRTNAGQEIFYNNENNTIEQFKLEADKERLLYTRLKKFKLNIFWFGREFLWKFGKWKNSELISFIKGFNPDIIYMDCYDSFYMHDILSFVKKHTTAKVCMFFCDDNCSYSRYYYSPLSYLKKFILRRKVRKSIFISEKLYSISEMLGEKYNKLFHKEFDTLTKGRNFEGVPTFKKVENEPILIVYTGNIIYGRWKTLAKLAESINNINDEKIKIKLDIYTNNELTEEIINSLNKKGVNLKGSISYDKVKEVQSEADILLHIESLDKKEAYITRFSFSTKLVDYFHAAKCILAIGNKNNASMKYLLDNQIGIVCENEHEIIRNLHNLLENKACLKHYAEKSWKIGKKNHDLNKIHNKLIHDFNTLINDRL